MVLVGAHHNHCYVVHRERVASGEPVMPNPTIKTQTTNKNVFELELENGILRDLLKSQGFRDRDIDVMVRALKRTRARQS